MKLSAMFSTFSLAVGMMASVAHADTFTGTVYNDPSGNVVAPSTLGTSLGTFTVSNFNFNIGPGYTASSPQFTIGNFLSYGGTNVVISPTLAAHTAASIEIAFTGSTYLVSGQTYTFTHDDGMTLSINGGPLVIDSEGQTVAVPSSFIYSGPTGVESFTLDYASNGFSPAVLNGSFTPAAATPEPSSIMMLGTGLLGVAGIVRRRISR